MTTPKVSVCVPSYNGAAYIEATIASVLAQSFTDFELVICDNASTDATRDICSSVTDPRFRYVRFDELVPQGANWNRCVSLARGELVILLHADDVLRPSYLQRAVGVLDANPDVLLVHSATQYIDTTGKPTGELRLFADDLVDRDGIILRRLLLEGCVINPAGVLVRRTAFQAAGPFTDAVVWGVDWHMWLRIALAGPVAYLAEPLALYRVHPQSGTSNLLPTARNARDEQWVMNDIFRIIETARPDLLPLRTSAMRQVAHRTWCIAEDACRQSKMQSARAGIRHAVRISPLMLLRPRVWALWLATFFGYEMFEELHRRSRSSRRRSAEGRA